MILPPESSSFLFLSPENFKYKNNREKINDPANIYKTYSKNPNASSS
jgi:hypothetical protein